MKRLVDQDWFEPHVDTSGASGLTDMNVFMHILSHPNAL